MYTIDQINAAYSKLKAYIYYDNTDILLRRQLVEFETNRTKETNSLFGGGPSHGYGFTKVKKARTVSDILEHKLNRIHKELNEYHKDSTFWNFWLDKTDVNIYPKKIQEEKPEPNFITNRRVNANYPVERETAFIDTPIEIHLLSVLWLMTLGVAYDACQKDCSYGNRLLLNQERGAVVQGSGLFKPYFNQYQKWRDESVLTAKTQLAKGKDILFLNLDVRDYFHSVRMTSEELIGNKKSRGNQAENNLREIFLKLHQHYTHLIADVYKTPYDFSKELSRNANGEYQELILPIGLLSSYVLANYYLKDFDKRITDKFKPAYYGRYVDDILIVITDPNPEYNKDEVLKELKFSFEELKETAKKNNADISFREDQLTKTEQFILHNFYPLLLLVDPPYPSTSVNPECEPVEKAFKLLGYTNLYCQSSKTLLYWFDHRESDLVIDKLKKELDARTSEFRDFPTEKENQETFEESAYHLLYDGTEGKVRTLKDYKENRFGLTIFLANKIFSALRHETIATGDETDQVLKFFRGINCISFYRLWERVLTYFLVKNAPEAYVKFYLHCAEQIQKLRVKDSKSLRLDEALHKTMVDFLDCAHELTLSLNPRFIEDTKAAYRNFEFQVSKIEAEDFAFFSTNFEPTRTESFWVRRFRESNMIRHSYVVHPLLNYTKANKNNWLKFNTLALDFKQFMLDPGLIDNSPRPVKFWECCLAVTSQHIGSSDSYLIKTHEQQNQSNLLNLAIKAKSRNQPDFYLNEAFELYKKINANHFPDYVLRDPELRDTFFNRSTSGLSYDGTTPVWGQEIRVNSSGKERLSSPILAFANTAIPVEDIAASIQGRPRLDKARYRKMAEILEKARKEKADMLLFPEFFTNINLLSSLVRYSAKNDVLVVTGLEHVSVGNYAHNFITILPVVAGGVQDAVPVFRLKNHYAHAEIHLIEQYHMKVPKPAPYRYDLFNWKNIYFSSYYCFELANALHRSMFRSKLDILIGVEWNKDTPYFSNIVEAASRDLHVFVAQVNTSQYGDTRLTQPVETARKDILKLKGGKNDAILTGEINIKELRQFQLKKYDPSGKDFKPLPPDFSLTDVVKRINNQNVLTPDFL